LSLIEAAGDAYHHTSQWIDDGWNGEKPYIDQINESIAHAADKYADLADEITRLRQQVATLTEQRDLAVEALARTRNMIRNYPDAAENCANDALAAIQSSEVTNHMKGVE
jgi:predicted  nucleic acid-binding Zn-ribbon protein